MMKKERIQLNSGRMIYTETWRNGHEKTLLYVHGGPGNGCWDFRYQAELLSGYCDVILYDQTGVMHSDMIPDGFGSEGLVDEIGEVLDHYRIEHPILCAHSYGAMLIMRYMVKHPERADALIYLCPCFCLPVSMRNVYLTCAKDERCSQQLRAHIADTLAKNTLGAYLQGIRRFDPAIWQAAYHIEETPEEIARFNAVEGDPREFIAKDSRYQAALYREDAMEMNCAPYLSSIQTPSLLVTGEFDPICTDDQIRLFCEAGTGNTWIRLADAGHTPYSDRHAKELAHSIGAWISGLAHR